MRWLRILWIVAIAAGVVACERREAPEPSSAPAPGEPPVVAASDPTMGDWSECINRSEGYAVAYPADWHANTGEILGACALFDPDPITVPRDSEVPIEIAIMIGFEPVPFETLAGEMLGRREIARERTTVDGREAVRIDGETTGDGLHSAGIRSYEYIVDLGDTTMAASTWDAGTLPFERKRRILDAMMATFDFRQPRLTVEFHDLSDRVRR